MPSRVLSQGLLASLPSEVAASLGSVTWKHEQGLDATAQSALSRCRLHKVGSSCAAECRQQVAAGTVKKEANGSVA